MTRLKIFSIAFLFIGFIQTNEQNINKLFYNLPLTTNGQLIKEIMVKDKNFKIREITSGFSSQVDFIEATISRINGYHELADSAKINLGSSFFYDENSNSKKLGYLKLTLYFKSDDTKNIEFDTIDKILNSNFKLRHFISNTLKQEGLDTIHLKGKKYFTTNQKKYPVFELTKNIAKKNNHFIQLNYIELDNTNR